MSTVELPGASDSSQEPATCPFCGAPVSSEQAYCELCGQPGTPLQEGTLLNGSYRIASAMSASSTGALYKAVDERHKRSVAIKELLAPPGGTIADRNALRERFMREAKGLEHLKHPCLPEIYAAFSAGGRHYIVMELLPGRNLETMLVDRGKGYSENQVRNWTSALVGLLEYLEERNPPFVHGEIQPSHVMTRDDGTLCVIGCGLAPRLGLRNYLELPGQPSMRAPAAPPAKEAKRRKSGRLSLVSVRDDIYGVGATLHAALTGRDALAGVDEPDRPFPPVREWAPRASVGMAEFINRAVSPDPALSFPSAIAMRAALAPLLSTTAQLSTPAAPPESPMGTRWWPVFAIGLVVVVAIVALVYIFLTSSSNTAKEALVTATPRTRNTPVATAIPTVAPPAQTTPFADTFIPATKAWSNSRMVYRLGGDLWLDNTKGATVLRAVRKSYTTGKSGFTLSGVVRLAKGPSTAGYGIVAANQAGPSGGNVALLLRGTGAWALQRTVAGHKSMLIDWHQSAAIRLGHNTVNELQLSLAPGQGQKPGTFSVAINGQPTFVTAQAWSSAPIGGVGVVADPSAEVVCDGLSVNASSSKKPIVNDYFLDNGLGWTGGAAPLVANDLMVLHPAKNDAWATASIPQYATLTGTKAFSEDVMLGLSGKTSGPPMGGLVFARATSTTTVQGRKVTTTTELAAVVDSIGRVTVVELTPGHSKAVIGPLGSKSVRRGYGLNLVHVGVTMGSKGLQARISINGSKPLLYTGTTRGLKPATGIAAVGKGAIVTAAEYRLFR
jgi:serine/threonine protein kinase